MITSKNVETVRRRIEARKEYYQDQLEECENYIRHQMFDGVERCDAILDVLDETAAHGDLLMEKERTFIAAEKVRVEHLERYSQYLEELAQSSRDQASAIENVAQAIGDSK